MRLKDSVDLIAKQEWLDPAAKAVQRSIGSAFHAGGAAGQEVMDFLHGTWLGHPLHAVLTDVPIGAWTAALIFDAIDMISGRAELGRGADASVAVGVLGASSAAIAGLTDWHHLGNDRSRRVGFVHAGLNTTAALLYTGSMLLRNRRRRGAGRVLSFAGYAVVMASAYLGGSLVYSQKIGVDHATDGRLPEQYVQLAGEAELGEGELRRVEADGVPVLLVKRSGTTYALADTCAHLGCSLSEGWLADDSVVCPCHGSRYALEDGRVLDGPSTHWQPVYDVRVQNGQIELRRKERS